MVTLDDIETHLLGILDNLHEGGAKFFELVNVVAIRLCHTAVWLAVLTAF